MSEFQPFVMEHKMGKWEVEVDYNLSESGVHPVKLRDLLDNDPERISQMLDTELNYPQVNGTPEIRQHIADMYEGAAPENVLVTVGAAEANFIAASSLAEPGEGIAVMVPNYMQIWGIAKNRGLDVKTFHLDADNAWQLDIDSLREAVTPNTKVIAVCNPNNPTGRAMTEAEINTVIEVADSVGAWIIADEVYAGAERLTDEPTRSLYGRYEKVVAIGSLSKAYGLPGLRIGWAVGPVDVLESMWYRHDYAAITTSMLANQLGTLALQPDNRAKLLARTRGYIRDGYPVLERWLKKHHNLFTVTPPDAAAIAIVRYNLDVNSLDLADRIREDKSVLIVPGDHFHLPQHLRISFGLPHEYLQTGLDRIHEAMTEAASS
jgi:aspartate/methionine/tyrosine aminotransferase